MHTLGSLILQISMIVTGRDMGLGHPGASGGCSTLAKLSVYSRYDGECV